MEFRKPVVVATDGSSSAADAVRWAAREAQLHQAPLHIVTAIGYPMGGVGGPLMISEYVQHWARVSLREAVTVARELRSEGGFWNVQTKVLEQPPRQALIELSQSAQMLVLGSRGLGEITGGMLGSVTSALSRHARCPVVVVRELPAERTPARYGPVVVGIDGSENSEPALAAAFAEASLRDTRLEAVHAWSDVSLTSIFGEDRALEWSAMKEAEKAVLAERLAGWRAEYPDVAVTTNIAYGPPAGHLTTRSDGASLLVIGSRGRGGFRGLLLGSTSARLLRSASCPLMIIRTKEE